MKTILHWNCEYLAQDIACPLVKDEDAVEKLKELVAESLIGLGLADTEEKAKKLVATAYQYREEGGDGELNVSDFGASVMYGDCYEDQWTIVDTPQEFLRK